MKLIEDWKEKFQYTFKFHPNRDVIMDRILSDVPISTSQLDKWFQEADDYAQRANDVEAQRLSGEAA